MDIIFQTITGDAQLNWVFSNFYVVCRGNLRRPLRTRNHLLTIDLLVQQQIEFVTAAVFALTFSGYKYSLKPIFLTCD